jgi:dynein heavy chain
MPPSSGAITWARSIITRVKTPIEKFKSKPAMLTTQPKGKQVAKQYVQLAKKLTDEYESKKYSQQMQAMTQDAIQFLKGNILTEVTVPGGIKTFKVNFNPKLKVIIREAKFLDRIGLDIPHTIVSIALQDKEYMRHVDKLNQLLRSYNSALGDLRIIEKKLLTREISKLNAKMEKGTKNHNWFSLSISTFIKECQSAIDSFKEIKGRVLQHARNIEK